MPIGMEVNLGPDDVALDGVAADMGMGWVHPWVGLGRIFQHM